MTDSNINTSSSTTNNTAQEAIMNEATTTTQYSKTAAAKHVAEVNETLAKLAGGSLQVNQLFKDHSDPSLKYVAKPQDMPLEDLAAQAARVIKANAEMVEFTKTFKARPNDGAVAFAQVLEQTYGFGAIGKTTYSMFGAQRPEYRTVTTGRDFATGKPTTVEVPWGLMEFAPLDAKFTLQYTLDVDYGFCFTISVEAPKKNQTAINGLFILVEEYLKRNSIYRNKALFGVGRADPRTGQIVEPDFLNVYDVDREKIVYSQKTWHALVHAVLGRIERADLLRQADVGLGTKVLLHGENGTGKSVFATIAAQYALENGWGFIKSRYDEDISKVVAFAERLGTPVVVLVEDVEKLMNAINGPKEMDKLLDLFDGAGSKGREVMLVMTSNHPTELTKSMTRAGRIDRMIPVGSLDREAVERLIKVTIPAAQREDLDYDRLHEAYDGYSPAWIMEALKGVKVAAIIRSGELDSKLTTEDFIIEAESLREAWSTHQSATDRHPKDGFSTIFKELVEEAVDERLRAHEVQIHDSGAIVEVVDA